MKNLQIVPKIQSQLPAPSLHQTIELHRTLTPIRVNKRQIPVPALLNDGMSVDPQTGHLYLSIAGLELLFPIIVVRHGQTNGNVKEKLQGQIDGPEFSLNAIGREQVQRGAVRLYAQLQDMFAGRLAEFAQAGRLILLKSPLSRASETATVFTNYVHAQTGVLLEVLAELRLREMCFGQMEGWGIHEIADHDLKIATLRYRAEDVTIDWKGTGERFLDVVTRASDLLTELNTRYGHQPVLVIGFTHGIFINALRVVVADPALIEDDGRVAFRKHILNNAEAYWLGNSRQIAAQCFN